MARPRKPAYRTTRPRPESERLSDEERTKIAERVVRFFDTDDNARSDERDARLQRYAKFRQWSSAKSDPDNPWSDCALPDMLADSLRVQDALHNAVMSARPPIAAKGLEPDSQKKAENVDRLVDFQVFVEQSGEERLGELIGDFVNDGYFTCFVPWIREEKDIQEARVFDPIPEQMFPSQYFQALIGRVFPGMTSAVPLDEESWDWLIATGQRDEFKVSFFTKARDNRIEMLIKRRAVVYDGPCLIRKSWDDVLTPPRAENLQAPSPSNPTGAAHVILRDTPTYDEIATLQKSGWYDLLSDDDLKKLEGVTPPMAKGDDAKRQKDVIAGKNADRDSTTHKEALPQRTYTRLMCFDMYDLDGDGIAEDVIWWVLKEPKVLLRAKRLTEMYPCNPPRRPLVRKGFTLENIGLLEIMEPTHDLMKQLLDQTLDNGTIATSPFFFYRAAGGMRPEVIRLWPGEGYPLADPQRDVNFPQIRTDAVAFGLNMTTVLNQYQERATMVNDLSFGRVPQGKASALRTVSGMALVQAQAEARPERILRRFFSGLAEIWKQIHELNEKFLPRDKAIRVMKLKDERDDPFLTLAGPEAISGRFRFDFMANVFNTSRQALQQALGAILPVYISGIAVQSGVINPEGLYRLLRDWGEAHGQDPTQYITPPAPDSDKPKIYAAEAMQAILAGQAPHGVPAEAGGAMEHLQAMLGFSQRPEFAVLTPDKLQLYAAYIVQTHERAQQEQMKAQMIQQAMMFRQQQAGGGAGGRPAEGPPNAGGGNAPISGTRELLDESLPGAGGGANAEAAA